MARMRREISYGIGPFCFGLMLAFALFVLGVLPVRQIHWPDPPCEPLFRAQVIPTGQPGEIMTTCGGR